ncbi:MAG TPA: hypothetical protein VGP07_02025 [Polyangia bacterium]|jgi:hypothetical protein
MKRSLLMGLPLVALLGAGCGDEVPQNPTWAADVHPIMVAHCIRCHNKVIGDLTYLNGTIGPSFEYATYDDVNAVTGLVAYMQGSDLSPGITEDTEKGHMPPPPAAKLLDWQIETFRRWTKNPR